MSSRKNKLDLLVRVRYSNPLPPPPFPPKLLAIPTHPSRYAGYEFTSHMANETPFPMVVDAELGMPFDLSKWDGLWEYDQPGEDYDLNPDQNDLPELDPKDAFLVSDFSSAATSGSGLYNSNAGPSASSSTNTPASSVSWLRKSEHTSASTSGGSRVQNQDLRTTEEPLPDVSHAAQIADIEASFPTLLSSKDADAELLNLRHPSKPGLRAVAAYDILPDAGIWPNQYDLVRFSERPGERNLEVPDHRLDSAILRPVIGDDGEAFLSYYLTATDEESQEFFDRRRALHASASNPLVEEVHADDENDEDKPSTEFYFMRDYETVKIDTEVVNEFLLTLDGPSFTSTSSAPNGDLDVKPGSSSSSGEGIKRGKAFYKNIERKYVLKKKRQNKNDPGDPNKWDIIHIIHKPFTAEDLAEREDAAAEVQDPLYLTKALQEEEAMEAAEGGAGVEDAVHAANAPTPAYDGEDVQVDGDVVDEEEGHAEGDAVDDGLHHVQPTLDIKVNDAVDEMMVDLPGQHI